MISLRHIAYARDGKQLSSRDGRQRWSLLRGLFFAVAMSAGLLVVPGTSVAAPSHDLVAGTGTIALFGSPTLHVNAKNTANGANGSFRITYPDGIVVRGTVTCLFVAGNLASIVGLITESNSVTTFPEGDYIFISVLDNGEPGTAGPDMINFSPGLPPPAPTTCTTNPATPNLPIVQGNFQVFDS
jgi:hypothetical protein